jgi:hypothetical protein
MSDLVSLINTLPQPVTLPCVLKALPRPLWVNATLSQESAQPAVDSQDPRIFVLNSEALILSFVTSGPHSQEFEVGVRTPTGMMIAGYIGFPAQLPLAEVTTYAGVLNPSGSGTTCGACHNGEAPAGLMYGTTYYRMQRLKPDAQYDVPLTALEQYSSTCTDGSNRCAILQALTAPGTVYQFTFP